MVGSILLGWRRGEKLVDVLVERDRLTILQHGARSKLALVVKDDGSSERPEDHREGQADAQQAARRAEDAAQERRDDIEAAAQQVPALTSVATHAEEVGRACASSLLGLINETTGDDDAPVLITPNLKVRASTGSWRPRRENR